MVLENISIVGGVTKYTFGGGNLSYHFGTSRVVISGDEIQYHFFGVLVFRFDYSTLKQTFDTNTPEEYCDFLALNGFFKLNNNATSESTIISPNSAYGDLRNVALSPQVQISWAYNVNTDIVTPTELNGGTVSQGDAMIVLQTGTDPAGSAEFSSIAYIKHRVGMGTLIRLSALFDIGLVDSEQIFGAGDDENDFSLRFKDTIFGINIRQNSVDSFTPQTDFNIDKLDGKKGVLNPSGMLLDHTKLNTFEALLQGSGNQIFFIENPENGRFTAIHRIKYSNNNIVPVVFNSSFPLFARVINSGNTSNITMKISSMGGFIEGENVKTGVLNSFDNKKSVLSGVETVLFSIRNRLIHAGKKNRVLIFIFAISVGNDANKLSTFRIYKNSTLTGANFIDINTNNSVAQTDVDGVISIFGKRLFPIEVGKDSGASAATSDLELEMIPGDIFTLTIVPGATNDASGAFTWKENF